jgi:hypothetical protein
VTTPTGAPASGLAPADGRVWHTLNADLVRPHSAPNDPITR